MITTMARKPISPIPPAPTNKKGYKTFPPDKFFELIENYADHAGTLLYIYRMSPEINRALVGIQHNYIDRLDPPFPSGPDPIFIKHGGFKYMLNFNDAKLEDARLYSCLIEDHARPPILDNRELIYSNGNIPFLQAIAHQGEIRLNHDDKSITLISRPATFNPPPLPPTTDPLTVMLLTKLLEKPAPDTGHQVRDTIEIAKLMLPAHAAQNEPDPQLTAILQRIDKQNEAIIASLNRQPADPITTFVAMHERFGQLKDIIAPPAAAMALSGKAAPWWDSVLPHLAPIVQVVANKINALGVEPTAAPAPGVQTSALLPDAATPTIDPGVQTSALADKQRNLTLQTLNCIRRGLPGSAMAITIDTIAGRTTVLEIAGLGEETILAILASQPEWSELKPIQPRVRKFVQEFISWTKEEEEIDTEGEPTT